MCQPATERIVLAFLIYFMSTLNSWMKEIVPKRYIWSSYGTKSAAADCKQAETTMKDVPSNPGQNLHLVLSQIHAVASSSHLANSSSQLVVLSIYLVESSSHLVVSSILLTSPLLVYSSVILQLVVSHFNSPFSRSVYLSPSSGHAVSGYK